MVSPLGVVSRLLINMHRKTVSKAAPGDVPTLLTLRPHNVCPEVLGSAQILAATPKAKPVAGANLIPSSSCAGQQTWAVMEECEYN